MTLKANPPESNVGCPMHSASPSSSTDLTYNDYLKVPELLSLQIPMSTPAHHDELLFIIIHQSYELWFKLILHEMENAIQHMADHQVLRAHHFMSRTVQILRLLVQQIHILETMSPVEFLQFRDHLMPASGFQSAQFRELEFLAGLKEEKFLEVFKNRPELLAKLTKRLHEPDVGTAYLELLKSEGFAMPDNTHDAVIRGVLPIYQNPSDHLPLYLLSESLIEFDQTLGLWREHHVRVVERIIGAKGGTGGSSGVEYLRSTTHRKCFPYLWEVRTYLTK